MAMSGADIAFVKMHGCGNDYMVLDGVARPELAAGDAIWRVQRTRCAIVGRGSARTA